MTQPLISAIVSTYRAERYMENCLTDLIRQSVDDLEIVVIDSASPENEKEIVLDYASSHSNIRYLRTEERETVYQAWNRGIELATGRYLTNANTDDLHHPEALARLTEALEGAPEAVLAYADTAITLVPKASFEDADPTRTFRWPEFDRRLLFQANYIGPQPVWRRMAHSRYGLFDPRFRVAGDYEMWLRLAVQERFIHVPDVLGLYLLDRGSVENSNRRIGRIEAELARERHWPEHWGKRPSERRTFVVRHWGGFWRALIRREPLRPSTHR